MKALVTGGGGFLGRCIVTKLLERGDEVRILARGRYLDLEQAGVEGIQGDIRDPAKVGSVAHGVGRLVYTSTPSVVFDGSNLCGINETYPYPQRYICHYPATKAMAERYVIAANGKEGLLTTALRPHLVWGPGDRHLIPRVLQRARAGRLFIVGDGNNKVDVTYVENAAQAHLQAVDHLQPGSVVAGQVYFISQGEPVVL
ncbi:MAG: NAD-dependent epimerase/dehydratase family protein, partial [Deltaproteobacteria bacterium]|nr:NAD-dependent epimerase/dehydratase family protein [Deltaproteobacteria bacterium]